MSNSNQGVFDSLIENSLVGMYIIQDHRFRYANKRFADIFGYKPDEIVDILGPEDLVVESDRSKVVENVNARLQAEVESLEYEFEGKHQSGKTVYVRVLGNRIDYNGRPAISGSIIDVTKHHQLERELKMSEERLRISLETTETGIWDWDVSNDQWYASPIFYTMLGYKPEYGHHDRYVWLNRVHPEDRMEVIRNIQRILARETDEYRYEARMLHADGNYRWHQVIGSVAGLTDSGFVKRIVGIRRDITHLRLATENLRKQEEQLRALINALPDMMWLKNSEGVFQLCNKRVSQFFGKRVNEIIGKTDYDFVPKDIADHFRREDNTAMEVGESYIYEEEIEFADRHREILETIKTPLFEENGHLIGILGIGRDITKRKELEKSLRESEEKYRYIFENAPVGIFKTAATGEFVIFNDTLIHQFECCDAKEFEKHYDNVQKLWVNDSAREQFANALKKEGALYGYEFEAKLISGKIKWFSLYVQYDPEDKSYEGFCVDISSVKQNEADLIVAKEKAEENDRLKTAFLMNMSHEIRTPMNSILGFLEMLQDPDFDEKQKQSFFDLVKMSGTRLLDTIGNIIEISRIEAGQSKLILTSVDLKTEFQFLKDLFQTQAEAKNISLQCILPEKDEVDCIETDKYKLETILINLLKNAVKFTSEGSIEFGYLNEAESFLFFVKDTGSGIYPDKMELIFERFVQADMNLTRLKEGSGLGLAISQAYAEALGGRIEVTSQIGKGSEFVFRMPKK
ncbi:PAS domain S-box-containing protein [Mangrovibacterium diazotrophicum]|uniref:histidine kinase n=1 Tax=Mangrovibacterium diazotrophicum TaxID=1261403 RepID=A0A419VVL4_9BACT|nr:PAS domain S-box-containing protein [Mangrovibacterium diazotrophicum]